MKVKVWWEEMDKDKSDADLQEESRDEQAFIRCIEYYISYFKALPPVGMYLDSGTCDTGKITRVTFGIEDVYVYLEF